MHALPTYKPSLMPTEVKSVGYVRQNAWKKTENFLSIVHETSKIHIPYAHRKEDVIRYNANKKVLDKYARTASEIPTGSIVFIPNGKTGLLVEITSGIWAGIMNGVGVAIGSKGCNHYPNRNTDECKECRDSIVCIFSCKKNLERLTELLALGNTIEPFCTLYRDVRVIGKVDVSETDARIYAGMDSVGLREQFWVRV